MHVFFVCVCCVFCVYVLFLFYDICIYVVVVVVAAGVVVVVVVVVVVLFWFVVLCEFFYNYICMSVFFFVCVVSFLIYMHMLLLLLLLLLFCCVSFPIIMEYYIWLCFFCVGSFYNSIYMYVFFGVCCFYNYIYIYMLFVFFVCFRHVWFHTALLQPTLMHVLELFNNWGEILEWFLKTIDHFFGVCIVYTWLYCRVIFFNMGVFENVVYPKIVMLLGTIMINRMLLGVPPGTNLGPRQFPSPICYVISGMLHEHYCHITVSTWGNKEEHTYLFVSPFIYIYILYF